MFNVVFQEFLTFEHHMRKHSLNLILGGGMGLWLRDTFYDTTYTQPRSPRYPLRTTSRSTQDLDLLLTASIIIDAEAMNRLRDILATLNYQPSVQYLQFTRTIHFNNQPRTVKINDRFRQDDPVSDLGRHHAFDIFRIITDMRENDWHTAIHHAQLHQ